MADNTTLPGAGEAVRDIDKGGIKTQVMVLDVGGAGAEKLVDGTNRIPVESSDCVTLLSTPVSAAGIGTIIDTLGYGAVVVQISGLWQGSGYFEASNDGANWDTVLVFSRDNLSLQDIVTQNGLYTIRPSGRYLHYVCTNITGTATVNALGRAAEGVNAGDMLSLAMDRANNTPLNVSLMGTKQDAQGALITSDCAGPFYVSGGATVNYLVIDTTGYPTLTMTTAAPGTGTVEVFFSNDPNGGWTRGIGFYLSQSTNNALNPGIASHTIGAFTANVLTVWQTLGKYAQIRTSAGATGVVCAMLRAFPLGAISNGGTNGMNAVITQPVPAGTNAIGDVGIQYRANATGAATTSKFTSAATTNAALILTGARRLLGWTLTNTTASAKYFRIHNKATAPTAGTDSPAFIIAIPPNQTITFHMEGGIALSLGLGIMCTGAVADLDTTATAAGDVVGALFYA